MIRIRGQYVFGWALVFCAASATACSSSGGGNSSAGPTTPTTPTPTPTIALVLGGASATVVQGGSAPVTATVTRGGGFTGDVAISVEGAPTGVTAAVSNVVTTSALTTATITINVDVSTAPGTYTLTARSRATGVTDATAPIALAVTALPAYTLSVAPASLTLTQSATGAVQVTIGRTNYTGAVTLALDGAPAGVTAVFAPPSPTGTTSTVTLSVGAGVATRAYALSIRATGAPAGTAAGTAATGTAATGSAASIVDHTAPLTLTVNPGAWNASWLYRKQVTVTTGAASAPAGYSVLVVMDHAALVGAGKSLASGNDVRVVFWNGSAWVELDRALDGGSAWNTASTKVWFKTQSAIGAAGSDNNYYVHYGNAAAGAPPADRAAVFLFADDFEAANLNKWTQVPAGLWTVDNARAHSGTGALKYPAEDSDGLSRNLVANPLLNVADIYVESWWYLNSASTLYNISQGLRQGGVFPATNGYYTKLIDGPPYGWENSKVIGGTFSDLSIPVGPVAANSWTRVGTAMFGTTLRTFVNGVELATTPSQLELVSGNIVLRKFVVPAGTSWWIDDVIARRYITPEPGTALGTEQAAALASSQRAGASR